MDQKREKNYKVTLKVTRKAKSKRNKSNREEKCVYDGLCNIKENYGVDYQRTEMPIPEDPFGFLDCENPFVINDMDTYNPSITGSDCISIDSSCFPEQKYKPPQRTKECIAMDDDSYLQPKSIFSFKFHELSFEGFLFQLDEEGNYIDTSSDLNQLMSSDKQSTSKWINTDKPGNDTHSGHTSQQQAVIDLTQESPGYGEINNGGLEDDRSAKVSFSPVVPSQILDPNRKKYECDKCKQIFDQRAAFKQHLTTHKEPRTHDSNVLVVGEVKYLCSRKVLKTQEKFQKHSMAHVDPDFECNKCHKVFANQHTLEAHRKRHKRQYHLNDSANTFGTSELLTEHTQKMHSNDGFVPVSGFIEDGSRGIYDNNVYPRTSFNKSDELKEKSANTRNYSGGATVRDELVKSANDTIAKVLANEFFFMHAKPDIKYRKHNRLCNVCNKKFDRRSDLKRHFITHIVRSTIAKNTISGRRTQSTNCEICSESFTKVDQYKAHLRKHAKLTMYQCVFCDKTFGDSSNYCKHKKIHSKIESHTKRLRPSPARGVKCIRQNGLFRSNQRLKIILKI